MHGEVADLCLLLCLCAHRAPSCIIAQSRADSSLLLLSIPGAARVAVEAGALQCQQEGTRAVQR